LISILNSFTTSSHDITADSILKTGFLHDILLCKLSAYGLSPNSVKLLQNYFTGRKQQIKLQGVLSSWADIQKDVPQGSILGAYVLTDFLSSLVTKFLCFLYASQVLLVLYFSNLDLNICLL
jgi:hypothetical protein